MTLTEFLLARIKEDEDTFREPHLWAPRMRAECGAKRRIVEFNESWPVLRTAPPTFERSESFDPDSIAFRASQQIEWLTTREYRARFGDEPPATPMLRALAAVYSDHPDYRDEWR